MRTRGTAAGLASRATLVSAALLAGAALATAGCEPDPIVGAPNGDGGGGGELTTFTEIRTYILEPRCATSACHSGPTPLAMPRLDGPESYDAIVNVPSLGSSLVYVAPDAPDDSYLLHTVTDTAGDVGGTTIQMPQDDLPLDESEIDAIRAWIAAGAQND
jgi:hypothetical protein